MFQERVKESAITAMIAVKKRLFSRHAETDERTSMTDDLLPSAKEERKGPFFQGSLHSTVQ